MAKNLVIKKLTGSGTFTVPAGVTQISVYSQFLRNETTASIISAGGAFSLAATTTGSGRSWGSNLNGAGTAGLGQLGDNTILSKSSPVQVVGALSFTSIVAGGLSSIGLTAAGRAFTWGTNFAGNLGDNTILAKSSPVAVVGGYSFIQVANGSGAMIGLTTSRTAFCWGDNSSGRLGDGTVTSKSSPVAVVGGYSFIQVAAGGTHMVGLTASGQAYCWGSNSNGELGDNTTTMKSSPVAVVGGYSFIQVAAGYAHTLGLTASGQVYAWGANSQGQLGDGTNTPKSSPVAVVGGYSFSQLALVNSFFDSAFVGTSISGALTLTGQAYTWGYNVNGALGDNTVVSKSSPVAVVGGYSFSQLSVGFHCLGLSLDGRVYAWGRNDNGQLGDNTRVAKSSPVAVVGTNNFAVAGDTNFNGVLTVTPGQTLGYKTGTANNYFGSITVFSDATSFIIQYSA